MALLLIEQTNHCNLQCVGCPNRLNQRPKGYMKPVQFADVLSQLLKHYGDSIKHNRIALHGFGEPFTSPYFFDNLKLLDGYGFDNIDFSTNGMLLGKYIEELKKVKCLSWIRVSLNSSREKVMEAINTGATFERVTGNIKALLASKPRFKVIVQHLVTGLTQNETSGDFNDLLGEGFIYTRKRMHNYCGQVKNDLGNPNLKSCEHGKDFIFGGERPLMHWDGDLIGCCSDNTKWQVYGNAFKGGIFSKKNQQKKEQLNKQFKERNFYNLPLCRNCLV